MNDRDRLAAARLIALGWTRLDEERLARAQARHHDTLDEDNPWWMCGCTFPEEHFAAIAKAYREDTDAGE